MCADKDRGFNMWEHKLKNCLLKTAAKRLDSFYIFFYCSRETECNEMLDILSHWYTNECAFKTGRKQLYM